MTSDLRLFYHMYLLINFRNINRYVWPITASIQCFVIRFNALEYTVLLYNIYWHVLSYSALQWLLTVVLLNTAALYCHITQLHVHKSDLRTEIKTNNSLKYLKIKCFEQLNTRVNSPWWRKRRGETERESKLRLMSSWQTQTWTDWFPLKSSTKLFYLQLIKKIFLFSCEM